MNSDIATCVLVGNLTRDPEDRYTANGGVMVASFGLAVNRSRKLDNGEWEDVPNFFDVSVWDVQAQNVMASLRKGDRVIVQGELRWSKWKDKDGNDRQSISVNATNIGPALRWATTTSKRSTKNDIQVEATVRAAFEEDGEEPF